MLDVEPLAGNCRTNVGLILVIGRNDLDVFAGYRPAEVFGCHSRCFYRTTPSRGRQRTIHIRHHANFDYVIRDLRSARRRASNCMIRVDWTGNQGTGTSAYRAYSRAHEISAPGKTAIAGSSDPVFRGDAARWNPAELLIAALSACHQLWYLHLCADAGIVVVAYSDDASGVEVEQANGAGQFESVTLRPHAKLAAGSDENIARRLHDAAADKCFLSHFG